MKYLVIGCGADSMGEAIAYRLLKEHGSQVSVADLDEKNTSETCVKLRQLCSKAGPDLKVLTPFFDKGFDVIRDKNLLPSMFDKFDVVVSAVPAFLNPVIANAVLLSNRGVRKKGPKKTHYCDLGGVLEITEKLIHWDTSQMAKEFGVSIVPDCGLQPGLGNIIAADLLLRFDPDVPVESIKIYVGGLPYAHDEPPYYKKLFNLKGLSEIYYNSPLVLHKGKPLKIRKLSHYETISTREFDLYFGTPEIIKFEAAVTGGLGALPYYLQDKVLTLQEKTLRFEGHYNRVKAIPPENFEEIFTHWLEGFPVAEKDFTVMKVVAEGVGAYRHGKQESRRIRVEKLIHVTSDENWSSMQKTTGFTTAVLAKLIAENKADIGAYAPERAIDPALIFEALKKDFNIYERTTTLK